MSNDQPNTDRPTPSPTLASAATGEALERSVFGARKGNALASSSANPGEGNEFTHASAPPIGGSSGHQADLEAIEKEMWRRKVLSLGVMSPAEVDQLCARDHRARYLVDGLLPVKSIAIAGGESAIGKSPLISQLGICVAAGVPFLGMRTQKSRVLYFDLENDLYDCKEMRDSLVKHLGLGTAPDDFLLVTEPPNHLDELLKEVEPGLVVVDSLRSFRPDVTDKNANCGEWLKEIRGLSRTHGCGFLFSHHMRKPGQTLISLIRLEDCRASDWLQNMEGPRALVNQTDVRIAIAEGDFKPAALKLKWSRRVYGDSPLMSVERVLDVDEDPIGYRQLTGAEHLSSERREAFGKLMADFTTKEAKAALGRSDDPTNKFLQECKQLGLIEKLAKGQWRKLPGSYW